MTQAEYEVLTQRIRQTYIRIEIMNQSNQIVDEVSGLAISGSYDIDSESATRRTCSLTMAVKNKLIPSPTSPFWINKRFRLLVGIKHLKTDNIVWFNQGIYAISNPSLNIAVTDSSLSVSGIDLAAFQTGDLSGEILTNTIIEVDTPIHTAIRETLETFGGETHFLIENSPYVVPYKMEYDIGTNVWDIIAELTELYMHYESYYNEDGYFVFAKTSILKNDMVTWDFSQNHLLLDISYSLDYSNAKNYVAVWGKLKDDKTQPFYEITVNDANYPDSPFTIEKLGEPVARRLIIQEDNYFEVDQCKSRCEYEVEKHNNCAETIDVSCLPIYCLKVNSLVYFNRPQDGIVGKYAVKQISCDLGHDGTMNFTAVKVY